jgi:hypothetical protein
MLNVGKRRKVFFLTLRQPSRINRSYDAQGSSIVREVLGSAIAEATDNTSTTELLRRNHEKEGRIRAFT